MGKVNKLDMSAHVRMNDTLNNTLSNKQTPFRAAISKKNKKKMHKLV